MRIYCILKVVCQLVCIKSIYEKIHNFLLIWWISKINTHRLFHKIDIQWFTAVLLMQIKILVYISLNYFIKIVYIFISISRSTSESSKYFRKNQQRKIKRRKIRKYRFKTKLQKIFAMLYNTLTNGCDPCLKWLCKENDIPSTPKNN